MTTETRMSDEFMTVRNLLANLAMDELWIETRKLCDKFGGYEGAKTYLKAQYHAIENLQSELSKEGENFGD